MFMKLKPEYFSLESTTMWSFPNRGSWATHSGVYRGNWSPYIPRNIISRYSKEGDWILDQFMGSGTTLIEAKLLNRNAVGVDINKKALLITSEKLDFDSINQARIFIRHGNACFLDFIKDGKIDLICTHPPYADIIHYSNNVEGDISNLDYTEFCLKMHNVADECYRVLKNGKVCALMIGDIRKHGNVIPLGFNIMQIFLSKGFVLKEIVIKKQHNCKGTKYWKKRCGDFLLIEHEYIFIFVKIA